MSPPTNDKIHPLPTVPEEITASWLGAVLGQPVKEIAITDSIMNATASKIFVSITYDSSSPSSSPSPPTERPDKVCLKGGFNPAMLAMEGYSDILRLMYAREVQFFNDVAPHLLPPLSLPRVWWAGSDPTSAQSILVMEDLRPCFAFGDPEHAWPVSRVLAGAEQLAALHASTLSGRSPLTADPETRERLWSNRAYEDTMMGLAAMWDAQVLGEGRPPLPGVIRDDRGRVEEAMRKHFRTRNPRFECAIHADPHCGNTFFLSSEVAAAADDCRFLDWQTMTTGSCFHDLAYFVCGALSVADRRAHEMDVLRHYLAALEQFGGPAGLSADDEEVLVEYRKSSMAGLGWVFTPYEMQKKERVLAMCERYCAAMLDHRAIELVESLPERG